MEKYLDRPNLRDQIYDIVKEMIVMREIKPDEKINEERLADRLRVSRTPIRETLCRLENEGIVKVIPRRGAFVIKQCKERVVEILQVREILEGLVARLVAQDGDEKTLNKLRKSLERIRSVPEEDGHLMKYTNADIEFHNILLEACNNEMLQNMMGIVNSHLQIIRLRTVVIPGRARRTVEEHFRVLEAIEGGNANSAERLMRKHIESVRDSALKNLDMME
jgi:DNA-binding GntR family transcriptional regulator